MVYTEQESNSTEPLFFNASFKKLSVGTTNSTQASKTVLTSDNTTTGIYINTAGLMDTIDVDELEIEKSSTASINNSIQVTTAQMDEGTELSNENIEINFEQDILTSSNNIIDTTTVSRTETSVANSTNSAKLGFTTFSDILSNSITTSKTHYIKSVSTLDSKAGTDSISDTQFEQDKNTGSTDPEEIRSNNYRCNQQQYYLESRKRSGCYRDLRLNGESKDESNLSRCGIRSLGFKIFYNKTNLVVINLSH